MRGGRDFHIRFLGVHECGLVAVNVHMHCVGPGQQDCNMSLFACLLWGPCPVVTVGSESILLNSLLAEDQTPTTEIQQLRVNLEFISLGCLEQGPHFLFVAKNSNFP